jgi:NAD(P)-dependent dehydrogenase (short-subunit alcohol dehydrogenase family)
MTGAARINSRRLSARPYWGLYAASKAALDAMVKSYAGEMASTKVRANVFYPGAVRTAMRAKAKPGEDPHTLPRPAEIVSQLVDLLSPGLTETGTLYDVTTGGFSEI